MTRARDYTPMTLSSLIQKKRFPKAATATVATVAAHDRIALACEGVIDPVVFRANLTPEDLVDIEAGDIPLETLRAYAKSMSRQLEDAPIRTPIVSPGSSGLPYSEPDDRRHCRTCQNQRGGYCRALRPGRRVAVVDDIPRRCLEYSPLPHDPDSRTGRERWPASED